ncbi:MAG TPA: hypothetical protein VMK12_11355 [Anaeromyxobacteraceae bacterium]|nr:hypothetical protein [Anaeromyxobacteraceae bacterium]
MEFEDAALRDALATCRRRRSPITATWKACRLVTATDAMPGSSPALSFKGERGRRPVLAEIKIARRMAAGELRDGKGASPPTCGTSLYKHSS